MTHCFTVQERKTNMFSSDTDIILMKEVVGNNAMTNPESLDKILDYQSHFA